MKKKKQPFPQVTQKPKKGPITVNNYLSNSDILLKITASPADWEKLSDIPSKKSFYFDFVSSYVSPVWAECVEKTSTMGLAIHGSKLSFMNAKKHNRHEFVLSMKVLSCLLYSYFSYWFKKPKNKRPAFVKKIKILPEYEDYLPANPIELTAYCIKLVYGDYLKGYKIKFFLIASDDVNNFYITYIHDGRTMLKNKDNETLDLIHSLLLFHNYLASQALISTKCKPIFNLIDNLAKSYLNIYSHKIKYIMELTHEDLASIFKPLKAAFSPPKKS